ncbi:MAG: hypothetical protein JSS95_03860 [Acidobacteria bacterium]|nr:hypothetical protein [Acidobacteriota bacterium]
MQNTPAVATIASTTTSSIWSFYGPFQTFQTGFNTPRYDTEISALLTVVCNIPFRSFMSAVFGRNNNGPKLPLKVITSSQKLIDTVAALDELTNSSPVHGQLASRLRSFDITWELVESTDPAIEELRAWQAGLVQA